MAIGQRCALVPFYASDSSNKHSLTGWIQPIKSFSDVIVISAENGLVNSFHQAQASTRTKKISESLYDGG